MSHLLSVKNADDLRKAHEDIQPKVVELSLRINQSRAIYEGAKALRESDTWDNLDKAQQRAVELKLRQAEHAGVGLDGAEKERFREISRELAKLSTDFSNHVLDAKKRFELIIKDAARVEGWPQTLKQISAQSYTMAREDELSSVSSDAGEGGDGSVAHHAGLSLLWPVHAASSRSRGSGSALPSFCDGGIGR